MSQTTSLKTLIRKRGQVKGRLTRFKDFVSKITSHIQEQGEGKFELSNRLKIQLKTRLDSLHDVFQQFSKIHDEILELD